MRVATPVAVGAPGALIAGFIGAVALRVGLGGAAVRDSAPAGLAFAACLIALSVAGGVRLRPTRRAAVVGLAGGAVLCVPTLLRHLGGWGEHRPAGSYLAWSLVVAAVAGAEEMFLRGALFDAVGDRRGAGPAVAVTAACFALLHVPLYGWSAVPLDLVVGVWLGALRLEAGSPTAPAIAHMVADLAAWWLR